MKGSFLQVKADSRAQVHSLTCMDSGNKITKFRMEDNFASSVYHVREPSCMEMSTFWEEDHQHLSIGSPKLCLFRQTLFCFSKRRIKFIGFVYCKYVAINCSVLNLNLPTHHEMRLSLELHVHKYQFDKPNFVTKSKQHVFQIIS